jgi:hypothetical protein
MHTHAWRRTRGQTPHHTPQQTRPAHSVQIDAVEVMSKDQFEFMDMDGSGLSAGMDRDGDEDGGALLLHGPATGEASGALLYDDAGALSFGSAAGASYSASSVGALFYGDGGGGGAGDHALLAARALEGTPKAPSAWPAVEVAPRA